MIFAALQGNHCCSHNDDARQPPLLAPTGGGKGGEGGRREASLSHFLPISPITKALGVRATYRKSNPALAPLISTTKRTARYPSGTSNVTTPSMPFPAASSPRVIAGSTPPQIAVAS